MKKLLITGFCLLLGFSPLAGCGGGGSTIPALQPTPNGPPAIAVTIQQSAPTIDMGQSDSLTATVSNDPNNRGVDWTIGCPSGVTACGAMTSASSASGAADTYNAPSIVAATEKVIVTAVSVTDPTKFAGVYVTVDFVPPLMITSGSPPNGTVGLLYDRRCIFIFHCTSGFQMSASGGVQPYIFSWAPSSGSSLPPGLSLSSSGLISGTPTGAGTFNFVVTVADSESPAMHASANYTITIAP